MVSGYLFHSRSLKFSIHYVESSEMKYSFNIFNEFIIICFILRCSLCLYFSLLPAKAPIAVVSCRSIAFFLETPDCKRMAKSPISWGTSCNKIVIVVTIPKTGENIDWEHGYISSN